MKTMMITALLAGASLAAGTASATESTISSSAARITMPDARAAALKAHPGRITDAELEREAGGSGLRYSFDITSRDKTLEVGIDARTGAVLENKVEGVNPD